MMLVDEAWKGIRWRRAGEPARPLTLSGVDGHAELVARNIARGGQFFI
jgi:hypothetical protein